MTSGGKWGSYERSDQPDVVDRNRSTVVCGPEQSGGLFLLAVDLVRSARHCHREPRREDAQHKENAQYATPGPDTSETRLGFVDNAEGEEKTSSDEIRLVSAGRQLHADERRVQQRGDDERPDD